MICTRTFAYFFFNKGRTKVAFFFRYLLARISVWKSGITDTSLTVGKGRYHTTALKGKKWAETQAPTRYRDIDRY